MSTYNRLDLRTLGSQPIMPKNLPDHWATPIAASTSTFLFWTQEYYRSLPRLDAEARNNECARNNESVCLSPSPISIGNETSDTRWNLGLMNCVMCLIEWICLIPYWKNPHRDPWRHDGGPAWLVILAAIDPGRAWQLEALASACAESRVPEAVKKDPEKKRSPADFHFHWLRTELIRAAVVDPLLSLVWDLSPGKIGCLWTGSSLPPTAYTPQPSE